ncbi:hypothetical protein RUM44_004141 [Polyplax serrata]|uniref:Uncharacterized protein n=1 Tax=Polyplax serrata TaxID=468196 RepID=A0ABR1B200_POLSC
MQTVAESDICPPCIARLRGQVVKAQEDIKKTHREQDGTQEKGSGNDSPNEERNKVWLEKLNLGHYEKASPEEAEKCIDYISQSMLICDLCKASDNISVLRLPNDTFKLQ